MRRCHWVKPVMVCQIKFTEWTRDDRLRQPVFLGIREDKRPEEVGAGAGELKSSTTTFSPEITVSIVLLDFYGQF